jgi:hypothetical protein
VVLQGFLGFCRCTMMVNRGEVVVNCVVNADGGTSVFRGRKIGHHFQLYFLRGESILWKPSSEGTEGAPVFKRSDADTLVGTNL